MRIGGFGLVAACICLCSEYLQKSILGMHRIARLRMLCVLLNVEEETRRLTKDLEVSLLGIRYLFSLNEDGSAANPVTVHHVSELLKAGLLHF